MREGGDDGNGDSEGDGGWWGGHKVPPTGHGGATRHQKGGKKGMLLSHHTQRKTERSSYKAVTNEPAHEDTGPHCPPGPDGPRNKSAPAGMSCPCQSCSSAVHALPMLLWLRAFHTSSMCILPWAVGRAGVWLGEKQPCASLQE